MSGFLSEKERTSVRLQHRCESERRYADRIKALLLWDEGWSFAEISRVLLLDESTIRGYRDMYESDGMERLLAQKNAKDPVYFSDGTHPVHNSEPAYGWIVRGEEKQIRANTGLNLNGALNAETHEVVIREDDTINAQSTIGLFQQLEELHPNAEKIYVVLDNARYYRSRLVKEYVLSSRIELLFLPPYAPNLNLIERLWKFFKKKVLANRYYESFLEFYQESFAFFENLSEYEEELDSLLTLKFQIIDAHT